MREVGLQLTLGERAGLGPDVVVSPPVAERGRFGFLNERAFLDMVAAVYDRVTASLAGGRFPLVYGADCAVLLAAVPALADFAGAAGLVFVDGHQDATPMEASATGEAANMEVEFLLGLTGQQPPEPLRSRAGVLRPEAIVMLGMRDEQYRREIGITTIAGRVQLLTADDVHIDPAAAGTQAAERVASRAPGWWLHTDLDVLAGDQFSACGAAHDPAMPGGLSWAELTALVSSALRAGGCRGWSVGVYNPDLDPERRAARQIVTFLAQVLDGVHKLRRHSPGRLSSPDLAVSGVLLAPCDRLSAPSDAPTRLMSGRSAQAIICAAHIRMIGTAADARSLHGR